MKRSLLVIALIAIALPLIASGFCMAGDMDDGISKFTDESIAKDDELGEKDPNLSYIMLKAQSKSGNSLAGSGGANMNSAVIGPGSNIKGDIIIIDKSKGDKTQVVK